MKNTDTPRTATEAQINANRENAKKSSGPRTAAGKAASSRNGLKHGLSADKHILPGENPDDFLFLLQDLLDRFRPEGPGEESLVLRIAAGQWRLDRAFPMEAGIFRDRFHDVAHKDKVRQKQYETEKEFAEEDGEPVPPPPTPPAEGDLLARAFNADCEGPNSFTKLARYETSIKRSIDRCLRQLKAFQAARNTPDRTPQPDPGPAAKAPDPPETTAQSSDAPLVGQAVPPADPAAAPPRNVHYEANPKNGGTVTLPNEGRCANGYTAPPQAGCRENFSRNYN